MLKVQGITKYFGDFKVLSDISFEVRQGEIYGLIGYNGVGKTTLLKIICGIYRPDGGNVLLDGESVYENASAKGKCFFMTEESAYFAQSNLMQMRRFYKGYYPGWSDKTFFGLTDLFGVSPEMKISRFSKGMQRQAGLILAFSTRSPYLYLDEAFDGLDFTMRRMMKEMLKYYAENQKGTMIISSHNLKELEDLADHIGMLSEGELVFNDSTARMGEQFHTCLFRTEDKNADLSGLKAQLLEKEGEDYLCIMECTQEEAAIRLKKAGAVDIRIRPIQLEEFFRKERKEKEVDWKEIFE